ncbi:hypothetical protein ACOMCU_08385 [Lysinibacillus sp. UGB7]|uniref:hypothetical protein n=1 Tax=Lysinibacillus sp. UGB7 TaxID=3411039 RepID=UPI003B7E6515
MKEALIKAFAYSYFGKLTKVKLCLSCLAILILPIVFFLSPNHPIIVFPYYVIFLILIFFAYRIKSSKENNFFAYDILFNYLNQFLHVLLLITYVTFCTLFTFREHINLKNIETSLSTILTWILGSSFIIYMLLLGIFLVFLLNLLFFIILKSIFPNTLESKTLVEKVKLKDISSFLTLDEQITYLGLSIVHLTFFFTGVAFYSIALLQIDNSINDINFLQSLVTWSNDNQIISLGNLLGLLSIMITVLSLSIPSQVKLKTKAINLKNSSLQL